MYVCVAILTISGISIIFIFNLKQQLSGRTNLEEDGMEGYESESKQAEKDQSQNSQFVFEDLVHNDEEIQDSALKNYYLQAKVHDETKKKVMAVLIFFSRTIKPVIILIFVIVYWGSGLYRTNQIE